MSFPVKALYGDQIRRFCLPHGAELSTALERVCGIFGLSERLTGLSVDDMEGGGSIFVNTDEQWHKAVRISLTKVPPLLRVRITETTGELHMKKATGELHEPTGELHEIDELKAELMALKRQITPLKKEKNTLKAERDALLGDKTLLETLTKAEKAKEEATAKLAEAEKRITEGWTERLKWKVVCQNMKAKLDDTVQTLEKEKAKLLALEAEKQQLTEQKIALEQKVAELTKTNSEITMSSASSELVTKVESLEKEKTESAAKQERMKSALDQNKEVFGRLKAKHDQLTKEKAELGKTLAAKDEEIKALKDQTPQAPSETETAEATEAKAKLIEAEKAKQEATTKLAEAEKKITRGRQNSRSGRVST